MSAASPGFIERDQWKTFLDEFSKRNQARPTKLEVVGEIGAQEQEAYVPLVGISLDPRGSAAGSLEVILAGQTSADKRRVEKVISNVERLAPILGTTVLEQGLAIEDRRGTKTLLLFETMPELEENNA